MSSTTTTTTNPVRYLTGTSAQYAELKVNGKINDWAYYYIIDKTIDETSGDETTTYKLYLGETLLSNEEGENISGSTGISWDSITTDQVNEKLVFQKSEAVINPVGGIAAGTTFTDGTPILEVLEMLLYPYVDLAVSFTNSNPSTREGTLGTPINLTSATFYIVKNSAKGDMSFTLYDLTKTTDNGEPTQIGVSKTANDIADDGTLIFSDLNYSIDSNRDIKLECSYLGEGNKETSKSCSIGSFMFSFTAPTTPTIEAKLDGTTKKSGTYEYKSGQSVTISDIKAEVSNLNSARVSESGGIQKFELIKDNQVVSTWQKPTSGDEASAIPTSYTFDHVTSLKSDDNTKTYKYEIKAYYQELNGDKTTKGDLRATSPSSAFNVKFIYEDPTFTDFSLDLINGSEFSKLDPQAITTAPSCSYKKRSGKINTVELHKNNTKVCDSKDSVDEDLYASGYDNNTIGTSTFEYTESNICSNATYAVKAFDANGKVVAQSNKSVTFYPPYCYGFINDKNSNGEDISLSDINLETLINLSDVNGTVVKEKNIVTNNIIQLNAQGIGEKRFFCAFPNGNFTQFKASAQSPDNEIEAFMGCNKTTKETPKQQITFADGSKVIYQIFLAKETRKNETMDYLFAL